MKKNFKGLGVKESEIMPSEYGIKLFLILSYVILFILCASSCMSDRTALQRVLTKQPLFDTVGTVYTSLHPCNPITIVHHSDTSYLHDTSTVYKVDTVGNYIHDTTVRYIRTVQRIHDRDTIVDGQQNSILKSQIEGYKQQIATLNGAILTKDLQITKEHSRGNEAWTFLGLLIAAIIISFVFVILKPKI